MEQQSNSGSLAALSDDLARAVEQAAGWTVAVHARRRFPASGVVWSADGAIVTADHVIEQDEDIRVTLPSGDEATAKLVARDPGTDIAVLRVGKSLTAAGQSAEKP